MKDATKRNSVEVEFALTSSLSPGRGEARAGRSRLTER